MKLKSFSIDLMRINKPKKWDGKWRVVMFDLPVRFSKARHFLRFKIKQLGFVQFQKSVWIYPYPCTDEILFIAEYYKVRKYIEMMTVLEISDEKTLKERFDL
jgi:DNA-binding transcriptional regulator PaaX